MTARGASCLTNCSASGRSEWTVRIRPECPIPEADRRFHSAVAQLTRDALRLELAHFHESEASHVDSLA